jgi:tetratricopeptide (TPR) repeat protein
MKLLLVCVALCSAFAQAGPNEWNDEGLKASDLEQYDRAEKLFQQAIAEWRSRGPAYDLHVAVVQNNLAQVYCVTGDRVKCAATLEEALPAMRRALGIEDLRTLTVVNLLGGVYMMIGDHARAARLFNEALPVERASHPNDAQLARTLSGLASLAMQENRAAEAAPFVEEGLQVALAAEGEDTLDAAIAYANMAELHRVMGRPERAEPLFRKARMIYEKKLGPEHPRVVSVLTQEGLMSFQQGKLGTAEQQLTRALEMIQHSCPKCGYERMVAENDLALLRVRQGKLAEADELLTHVLAWQDRAGSLPPAEIAVTLNSLAAVRQRERRYDDAERLKRRAAVLTAAYR